jgi:Serine phosphatase RsbU, regulator of sigma subunit
VNKHAQVVARRRRTIALRRTSERIGGIVRGFPIVAALVFILMTALLAALIMRWPSVFPFTAFVPLIVLAGLFLPPRWLALVLVVNAGLIAYDGWVLMRDRRTFIGFCVVIGVVAAMMTWLSVSRARLGVQGTLGESMLVDLRDRLRAHGELPTLPEPWHAEVALKSAFGESFSGDFVVASRSNTRDRIEVALVDVSGKGVNAGTRALLLSGAFGGLLGAMDPVDFLDAANSYLLRQDWDEGFATAIYIALDLDTGRFRLSAAGHPPAVKFWAGSGLWQVLDTEHGPLLGVLKGASFPSSSGELGRGDALLLYTDGVIETRTRDLQVGIDRMLGAAERLVTRGFSGGASRICAAALAGETDDRAVVLIWRS